MVRKKKRTGTANPGSESTSSPSTSQDPKPVRARLPMLNKGTSVTKIASLLVLVVIIILIMIMFYRVMANFVLPLFLAALFSVLFRPIHSWMLDRIRGRETLAAGLTTAAILGIVLMPLIWIGAMAIGEATDLLGGFQPDRIVKSVDKLGRGWPLKWKGRPFRSHVEELDKLFADLPNQVPDPNSDSGYVEPLRDALRKTEELLGRDHLRQDSENPHSVLSIYKSIDPGSFEYRDEDSANETAVKIMANKNWVTRTTPEDAQDLVDDNIEEPTSLPLAETDSDAEPIVEFPELENLIADLNLALGYLRSGKTWAEELDKFRVDAAKLTDEKEIEKNRSDVEEIENKLNAIRVKFPRLNENWMSVRAKLHGGTSRMLAHDVFFPTPQQVNWARNLVEDFGFRQLTTLPSKATAVAGHFIAGIAIMILGIFYFLKDGPGMIRAVMRLSPLDDRYEKELLSEFDSVSRAVVMATLLSAFAQGVLAGIGYYFAGFEGVLMLMMLTMVIAMVPVVGAAAVWVPACIWLAVVDNRVGAAIGLAIYGALIVSMVDNLIKPLVLHGQSNLHPLLALLSVLGGVSALGPIGIIVGPMVVSFLQALLNMLHLELQDFDRQAEGDAT